MVSSRSHIVRVGVLGNVGRFMAVDACRYPRGARVIVRTARGLEVGEVLAPPAEHDAGASDGPLLRGMTVADELLDARLQKHRATALDACQAKLVEHGLGNVALMDFEHLFDGQTVIFYFLGDSSPQLEALTSELAALYDARVQFSQFADTLAQGCGPGCGTEQAEGHGCTSCGSGCAIAEACGVKRA